MKRTSLAILLLIALLWSPLLVRAQEPIQCETYSLFPGTDWTVDVGNAGVDQVVRNVQVIPGGGPNYWAVAVHRTFAQRTVYRVVADVYFNNVPTVAANLTSTLTLGGNGAGVLNTVIPSSQTWHTFTQTFYPAGNRADRIDILLKYGDPDLALRVRQVCFLEIPPTNTPTSTPIPPTVPTDTPTPDYTDTPIPPTNTGTPPPTSTITRTPLPTRTPVPATLGSGAFNTPVPPQACRDPFNPCGALPFPLPNFSNLNLPSPVPITAIAFGSTATLIPGATLTAGPGPATGTLATGQADIYDYATNIANAVAGLGATPGLLDDNSQLIDIANSGNQIGSQIGGFFAVVRAVQGFFLGKTGNIIALLLLLVAFIIIVNLLCFAYPILKRIAEFIFNIVKMIPFIG